MSTTAIVHSVEPAYFGPPERALLGCYHAPEAPVRDRSMLLCYPCGHEYIRSQRAFRRLADRLARAGFPTFRFDYLGTGDSARESDEVRLEDWRNDVVLAAEQVRARTGMPTLDFVGLRLGATLGMLSNARVEFDRLVLWEPVVDGARYTEEMREAHRTFLESQGLPASLVDGDGSIEVLGMRYQDALFQDLESIALRDVVVPAGCRVLLIDNAEAGSTSPTAVESFAEDLRRRGASVRYERRPDGQIWLAEPFKQLLPHESMRAIIGALAEGWT